MTTLGILILILLAVNTGIGFSVFVLLACLYLLMTQIGIQADLLLFVSYCILAIPLCTWLIGMLLDHYTTKKACYQIVVPLLSFVFILKQDFIWEIFEEVCALYLTSNDFPFLTALIQIFSACTFCITLVAFTILVINSLIEIFVAWILSATKVNIDHNLRAFRIVFILFITVSGFNLVTSMLLENLGPAAIVKLISI